MNFSDLFNRRTQRERITPEESFSRVDEDLIHAAETLKPFLKTEAYQLLVDLIAMRRREIATMALEDDGAKTKDWWKGFHAGAGSLAEIIKYIEGAAESAEDERGTEKDAAERMGTAGGDLAI